MKYIGLIEH